MDFPSKPAMLLLAVPSVNYWMLLVKKLISHHKEKIRQWVSNRHGIHGFYTTYLTTRKQLVLFKTHLAAPYERHHHTKLTFLSTQDSVCLESIIQSCFFLFTRKHGVRGRGLITSFMLPLMTPHKISVFIFPTLGSLLCK